MSTDEMKEVDEVVEYSEEEEEEDDKTGSHRVSHSIILGMHIPTSRVRKQLDSVGINRTQTEVITYLESCNPDNFDPYNCEVSNYFKATDLFLKPLPPKKNVKKSEKNSDSEEEEDDEPAVREPYTPEELTLEKVTKLVSSTKYRISNDAVVSLTYVVDKLAHQLVLHAIRETIYSGKKTINFRNVANKIDTIELYSLINSLSTFQKYLHTVSEMERVAAEKSNKKSKKKRDDTDSGEDTEIAQILDEDAEQDQVKFSSNKTDQRSREFFNFVTKIAHPHLYRNEDKTMSARLTEKFRVLVSDILCEFISERMVNVLRTIMSLTKSKTVSENHILSALNIMMTDGIYKADFNTLNKEIKLRITVLHEYLKEVQSMRSELTNKKDFVPPELDKYHARLNISYEAPVRPESLFPKPSVDADKLKEPNSKTSARKSKSPDFVKPKRVKKKSVPVNSDDEAEEPEEKPKKKTKKPKSDEEKPKKKKKSKSVAPEEATEETEDTAASETVVVDPAPEEEPVPEKKSKKSKK